MTVREFLIQLKNNPDGISFSDTIQLIDTYYHFEPTAFKNGPLSNEPGQNTGSCKVFSFAQHNKLSKKETLACFGSYYRNDVLNNPNGDDHQNIRNFIKTGWEGIEFSKEALYIK